MLGILSFWYTHTLQKFAERTEHKQMHCFLIIQYILLGCTRQTTRESLKDDFHTMIKIINSHKMRSKESLRRNHFRFDTDVFSSFQPKLYAVLNLNMDKVTLTTTQ